jgi:hypothetical protein
VAAVSRDLLNVPILGRLDVQGAVLPPTWPAPKDDPGKTRAFLTGTNAQAVVIALRLLSDGFSGRVALLGTSIRDTIALLKAFHHFATRQSCNNGNCRCNTWLKHNSSPAALLDHAVWSGNGRLQSVIRNYQVNTIQLTNSSALLFSVCNF